MLEYLFNKVVGLKACHFIKKRLQHRYFPVKLTKFLRKLFYGTPLVANSQFKRNLETIPNFNKMITVKNQCSLMNKSLVIKQDERKL